MAPKTKLHAYLEIEESHYIGGVARISFGANYRMYALMANVRNADGNVKPVANPKMFPAKISAGAKAHFEQVGNESKDGLHDHSWLSTDEVAQVLKNVDTFIPGLVAAAAAMEALEAKGSNPRLLIAFED